jgi:hypothetical protein
MITKLTTAIFLAAIVSQTASGAEWEYCLAPSNGEHKVYISDAFETDVSSWKSGELFEHILVRSGLQHDVVQCPRADSVSAIMTMRQHAVAYNNQIGRTVIYVRWEAID